MKFSVRNITAASIALFVSYIAFYTLDCKARTEIERFKNSNTPVSYTDAMVKAPLYILGDICQGTIYYMGGAGVLLIIIVPGGTIYLLISSKK
jgi:hypothetical protein